ncbi:MAG: hypothetical protein WCR08_04205, partial [Gammaproteobacteria bacterium]
QKFKVTNWSEYNESLRRRQLELAMTGVIMQLTAPIGFCLKPIRPSVRGLILCDISNNFFPSLTP